MFLNPLGLLALLGVPAVVALHLFRRRFRRERVSALFLWEARTTTSVAGRRRDNLLRSPSFWSELLLALLLGLAFAGPRGCSQLEAKHLVVVLDGSASMSAQDPASSLDKSAAALAREALRESIADLPSGSRVTVVESGPVPHIRIGPAAFPEEALARVDEYAPAAARHDLGPAAVLALEIAADGAVTLYTDQFRPERFPEQVGVQALGSPRPNLAITRAARFPGASEKPGEEDVFITVANFSARSSTANVQLTRDGQVIAEAEHALGPGERTHFQFTLEAGTPLVEARLPADALATDNYAPLAPGAGQTLALFTDLDEPSRKALGLQEGDTPGISRWLALVRDSAQAFERRDADLVLSSRVADEEQAWVLHFSEPAGEPLDLIGPFLIEKRHGAVSGMLLDGVVWSANKSTPLPGTPLISAGNLPLLTEEILANRRVYHMNIRWARSSLQRTPDWPILLANLAELRRRELDGPRDTNVAVGDTFHYHRTGAANYVLRTPGGTRELRATGALAIEDLRKVGVYTLEEEGESIAQFAVHFADDAESDLREADPGTRVSSVDLGERRSGSSLVVLLLAVLALCALLMDWWVLRVKAPTNGARASRGEAA